MDIRHQGVLPSTKRLYSLLELIYNGLAIKNTEKKVESFEEEKEFFENLVDPKAHTVLRQSDSIWMLFRAALIEPYI